MSFAALRRLKAGLARRKEQAAWRQRRVLDGAQGVRIRVDGKDWLSFCSNDYLALAQHPALIAAARDAIAHAGVGAGASHLVCGHHREHEAFEHEVAAFLRLPAALLFSTGYLANLAVVSALIGRDGEVFADRLNHASLNDAALLSRANVHRFAHGDLAMLERQLAASTRRDRLVMVDAVFSMDGDVADVPALLALCERYDAWLLLDDAHGFGVLGEQGRGVLSHFGVQSPRIVYMATLGKAAGVAGAVVAGDEAVITWLLQTARPYVYTTAAPALLSAALRASLTEMAAADAARSHLALLIDRLREGLRARGWRLVDSRTPIQPVILGSNEAALAVGNRLEQSGILVPVIRPPTVPQGMARLRISLSAAHSLADIEAVLSVMGAV
jgi:8-amino-7-oxononanoate synthase